MEFKTHKEIQLPDWNQSEWAFGHHHRSVNIQLGNTNFVCLAELETIRLGVI